MDEMVNKSHRRYKVAHLLGHTRGYEAVFRKAEIALTLNYQMICYKPVIYDFEVYKQHAELLDNMCFQKLLECDLCVIVTPNRIGDSTINRINQAYAVGIPVYVWNDTDETISEFDVKKFLDDRNKYKGEDQP